MISEEINLLKDDPFKLIRKLKNLAPKEGFIDLSRGDPYNTPSIRADWVYNFFNVFSLFLQEEIGEGDMFKLADSKIVVKVFTKSIKAFTPIVNDGEQLVQDVNEFIERVLEICSNNQLEIDQTYLLINIAKSLRGSGYGEAEGNVIVRAILADYIKHSQFVESNNHNINVSYRDLILTLGASEAIGQLFELIEHIGFLKPNTKIASFSPVYGPYDQIIHKAILEPVGLLCREENGFEPSTQDLDNFEERATGVRIMVIVNPSNPTSRAYSAETLKRVARICKENNTIVIEDIVYYEFVTDNAPFHSISEFLPEQTIIVGSMSKYHQTTGSRFGYVWISDEANKWLTDRLKIELNQNYQEFFGRTIDFKNAFVIAKSPDLYGAFSHTHSIPQPIQWLGAIRLLLDYEDAASFDKDLELRWKIFYNGLQIKSPLVISQELKLESVFSCYYSLIDFKKLIESIAVSDSSYKSVIELIESGKLTAEIFFAGLASCGIIAIPAARFYINEPEKNLWSARFSLANQPLEQIEKASKIILKYISKYK